MDKIVIKGARENNLKNISLEIPRDKFVVLTGLSGSGKSTLAFDTIFAEGQRRYLESLSAYARQFLGQMKKPELDSIEGLSPVISINQKTVSANPRSTVGTVTEIYDYLRLLFAKVGVPYCPECNQPIENQAIDQIVDKVLGFKEGSKIEILSPAKFQQKGEFKNIIKSLYDKGYLFAYLDGEKIETDKTHEVDKNKKHTLLAVIDEIEINSQEISRIFEAVEEATELSQGKIWVRFKGKDHSFNLNAACAKCGVSFPEIEPRTFSFNSPQGACSECNGLGNKKIFDERMIIPDPNKSIDEGGVLPWSYKPLNWWGSIVNSAADTLRIPRDKKIKDVPEYKLKELLGGREEAEKMKVKYFGKTRTRVFEMWFYGLVHFLEKRYRETSSNYIRNEIEKYMLAHECPECGGTRLKKTSLKVKFKNKNIHDISSFSVKEAISFFAKIKLNKKEKLIGENILKEIKSRLEFLDNVGLGYLTLSRSAQTLSGGEAQRIRLASQLGSSLCKIVYILDEPSIGLHARDNRRLLDTLIELKDKGNTLIVIEHDEETMRAADQIIDIGPEAGKRGGRVVAQGNAKTIEKDKLKSKTAQYLSGEKKIDVPEVRRKTNKGFLTVLGAAQNNLKNLKVEIPLGVITCVTGVSGSGKSSLVNEVIYKGLQRKINRSLVKPGKFKELKGISQVDKVINVDQSPIGRTPRSNPATYTKVFTPIRELFVNTKDARVRGYKAGRFSFNVRGGRCENCNGEGFLKVEMQFLPDVYLPCEVCDSSRYNQETLKVRYKDKNIAEVLKMTVDESLNFFKDIPQIADILKVISEVGLGYIELGQPATTLSGGEAQRVKLATELAKRSTSKTLYILDEPTTGLHFEDINKLIAVLQRLVDQGNTVLIIEHNLDVIKNADWIIDLGPEGGDGGGKVIASGTPEEIVKYEKSSTGKYLKKALK